MSRTTLVRIEFVNQLQVVAVVELVRGQCAVGIAGFEERHRDHQGASELEGVVLGKGKIVRHFEGSIRSGPIPARWLLEGPPSVAITAKAKLERRQLASRPLVG
ncbi:hypothetical protein CHELA20_40075 [Hyphomicrobiales bacterium]|nr:hypothetical protein CHELA20_40075 [Hyphomicrobiales bacterium]CAH1686853.1 hypothetical protein CHELA41_30017 [Hyphomicrobiales bacterium]